MYNQHHGGSNLISSRTNFLSERQLFLQGGNVEDSGLVLSTDAKPRLKWTAELHERFIEAVNQLGGADKATPKTVMRLMGIPGLTLYHLKSHLQKYRLSKNLQSQANTPSPKNAVDALATDRISEGNGSFASNINMGIQHNKTIHINDALQMQIEVQRHLHEQLEVQRHLQLRIEAQGKYLQSVLEKAQETLGNQNLGSAGLEAAKVQLSELVSKVTNDRFTTSFSNTDEISSLKTMDEPQNDQEMHNISMGLRAYQGNPHSYSQPMLSDAPIVQQKSNVIQKRRNEDDNHLYFDEPNSKKTAVKQEHQAMVSCGSTQLDLNAYHDDGAFKACRKFDLNGFSWN